LWRRASRRRASAYALSGARIALAATAGDFARYRERLTARGDITKVAGLSTDNVARIRSLYPPQR